MGEVRRINQDLLLKSIFRPKPRDFWKTIFFLLLGVTLALLAVITLGSEHPLASELSFMGKFVAAVSVFLILEAWVIASYEELILPLKIVELEQRLAAGEFEKVKVAPQSTFHRWTNQYWPRTTEPLAPVAGKNLVRHAITGVRSPETFEGLLVEVARRPFLFKKWVVVPVDVLES